VEGRVVSLSLPVENDGAFPPGPYRWIACGSELKHRVLTDIEDPRIEGGEPLLPPPTPLSRARRLFGEDARAAPYEEVPPELALPAPDWIARDVSRILSRPRDLERAAAIEALFAGIETSPSLAPYAGGRWQDVDVLLRLELERLVTLENWTELARLVREAENAQGRSHRARVIEGVGRTHEPVRKLLESRDRLKDRN
jgi:hypothetical protein